MKSLESDIDSTQRKLFEIQAATSRANENAAHWSSLLETLSNIQSCRSAESLKQQAAVCSQRNHKTIKGIHKWKPTDFSEAQLSFDLIGLSPRSCIKICFRIMPDRVQCEASVDTTLFPEKGDGTVAARLKKTSPFLDRQVTALCEAINNTSLNDPTEVGHSLRLASLELGRLDCVASEIASLQRRYDAKIVRTSTSLQLAVEFSGLTANRKFLASFDLSPGYPFSPLNVCLEPVEGSFNMSLIQKQLIRNARPGFGYLSRTCDVLVACIS
jgi:hypothetical protein